jgi:DNA-directed RNA polymerase specialized sigma24 family protein
MATSRSSEPTDATARHKAGRIPAALAEQNRRILELRTLEACSTKEATRAIGVSVANVKVLQHRALRLAASLTELEP